MNGTTPIPASSPSKTKPGTASSRCRPGTGGRKPAPQRAGVGVPAGLFLVAFFILFSARSAPAGWNCSLDIHLHAVDTTISLLPASLRSALNPGRERMRRRVRNLHDRPDRLTPFRSAYRKLVAIAKERGEDRDPFFSVGMADLSMVLYARLSPVRLYDFCRGDDLLARTAVLADGYDRVPDYAKGSYRFSPRQAPGDAGQIVFFYNDYVNELADLWTSVWQEAGRNLAGIRAPFTRIPGNGEVALEAFLSSEEITEYAEAVRDIGRNPEAVQAFEALLRKNPENAPARFGLATHLYQEGKLREALPHFLALGSYRNANLYTARTYEQWGDGAEKERRKISYYRKAFVFSVPENGVAPDSPEQAEQLHRIGKKLTDAWDEEAEALLLSLEKRLTEARNTASESPLEEIGKLTNRLGKNRQIRRGVQQRMKEHGIDLAEDESLKLRIARAKKKVQTFRQAAAPVSRPAEPAPVESVGENPPPTVPVKTVTAKTPRPDSSAVMSAPGPETIPGTDVDQRAESRKASVEKGEPGSTPFRKKPAPEPAKEERAVPSAKRTAHETERLQGLKEEGIEPESADETAPHAAHPVSSAPPPTRSVRPEEPETGQDDGSDADRVNIAIQAFKEGYSQANCAERFEKREDLGVAEIDYRLQCCTAGAEARALGLRYYPALSDFLIELQP